jgi:hypothetical protein
MTDAVGRPPELPAAGVECPACGEDMQDTGRTEICEITKAWGRIMVCPRCHNECLWSVSPGKTACPP